MCHAPSIYVHCRVQYIYCTRQDSSHLELISRLRDHTLIYSVIVILCREYSTSHSIEGDSTPLHGGGLHFTPWMRAPLHSMEEGSTPWKRAPLHSMEEGSTPLHGGGLHSMEEGSTPLHGSPWWGIPLNSFVGDSTKFLGVPLNSMARFHSTPWTEDSTPWRWPQLYSIAGDSNPLHEMGLHYTPWRGTPLHSMEYKRRTGHQDKST